MINQYWKMKNSIDFSSDKVTIQFDIDNFVRDYVKKMQAIEDDTLLEIVIDTLRKKGYTVTKNQQELQ